jgi:hypothetical protein
VSISCRSINFSLLHSVHIDSEAHTASCPKGTGGSFSGGKLPGSEADHSLPSGAEVKNGAMLPLLNTSSWLHAQLIKHMDHLPLPVGMVTTSVKTLCRYFQYFFISLFDCYSYFRVSAAEPCDNCKKNESATDMVGFKVQPPGWFPQCLHQTEIKPTAFLKIFSTNIKESYFIVLIIMKDKNNKICHSLNTFLLIGVSTFSLLRSALNLYILR